METLAQKRLSVLAVDDDFSMLAAIRRQLTGSTPEASFDFNLTVSQVPCDVTGPTVPSDVALLDWTPYGPEMVKRCRAAGVPFVVYTGDDPALVPELRDLDAPVLMKPASPDQIAAALRGAVAKREAKKAIDIEQAAAAGALEAAQLNVARAAQDLMHFVGLERSGDFIKIAIDDFDELREACAEWRNATERFLVSQSKGGGR